MIKEDLSEKRYLRQLVGSYFSLYTLNSQAEQAIDQITLRELQDVFSSMAASLHDGPNVYQKPIFTFEELSKPLFVQLANEYLPALKHSDFSIIFYIAPKERYDIILDVKDSNEQLIKGI